MIRDAVMDQDDLQNSDTKFKTYLKARPITYKSRNEGIKLSKRTSIPDSMTRISKDKPKPKKTTQIYFKTSTNRITCPSCNMSYVAHLKPDNDLHTKFHQKSLLGRDWAPTWGNRLYEFRIPIDGKNALATMVEVDVTNKSEVKATKELLELVNTELRAPDDCGNWLKGKEFGKVFVCVLGKKAIGIVCLERITKGEWLILETGNIVPAQKIPLVAGISRIYVSRNYRRCHIGSELLSCTRKHFLYGVELKKLDIGWSQPSEFGSKLAFKFNSIKHKSGYNLLPIYVEE